MHEVRREQQFNNDGLDDQDSWSSKDYTAIHYDITLNYKNDHAIFIGNPTIICKFYSALKWKSECKDLCFSNGKVKLDDIVTLQELLNSHCTGSHPKHKFTRNIRYYSYASNILYLDTSG